MHKYFLDGKQKAPKHIAIEGNKMKQIEHELQLITQNDLCEILKISLTTLWRWEQQKSDFPKKIRLSGKGSRYLYKDVKRYIENNAESDV